MVNSKDNSPRNGWRDSVHTAAIIATLIGSLFYFHNSFERRFDGLSEQLQALTNRVVRIETIIEGWQRSGNNPASTSATVPVSQ